MTHNLVICRFPYQRSMVLNLCTFLGHTVYSATAFDKNMFYAKYIFLRYTEANNDPRYFTKCGLIVHVSVNCMFLFNI